MDRGCTTFSLGLLRDEINMEKPDVDGATPLILLENMRLVRAILIRAYLKPSRSLEFSIN